MTPKNQSRQTLATAYLEIKQTYPHLYWTNEDWEAQAKLALKEVLIKFPGIESYPKLFKLFFKLALLRRVERTEVS